jgi:hypothetical protein
MKLLRIINLLSILSIYLSQIITYYSGQNTTYYWTTANTLSYLCTKKSIAAVSGQKNNYTICSQTEYPKTQGGAAWELPNLTCPSGSTIACFVYASFGRVGGRCDGGEVEVFKEDPSGEFTFIPESLGNSLIGKSTFTFSVVNQTINGVDAPIPIPNTMESNRLKVVALCQSQTTNSSIVPSLSVIVAIIVGLLLI